MFDFIPDWLEWIIAFLIVREIAAHLFGWKTEWMNVNELMENRKHNAAIDRKWKKDGKPIVATTVGWRPDPWNKQDGYRNNHDGSYSRLIRGGTKEYREQFERDVEASKKDNG